MTVFQLLMLGASAFFAFRIYEHIQTLQDPQQNDNTNQDESKTAEAFSPFDPEALVIKADEAYEEKDFQKAVALLIEADAKQPNNQDILFKIGYILQQLGDNNEAMNYYKKALEIDKNDEFIHNSMASIYRANSEFVSARMHLNDSLAIDDANPMTYYNYGNLLVDMEHYEEAKTMYEKALELNPEFTQAKDELGKL